MNTYQSASHQSAATVLPWIRTICSIEVTFVRNFTYVILYQELVSDKTAKELVSAVLSKFKVCILVWCMGYPLTLAVCHKRQTTTKLGGPSISQSHALSKQLAFALTSFCQRLCCVELLTLLSQKTCASVSSFRCLIEHPTSIFGSSKIINDLNLGGTRTYAVATCSFGAWSAHNLLTAFNAHLSHYEDQQHNEQNKVAPTCSKVAIIACQSYTALSFIFLCCSLLFDLTEYNISCGLDAFLRV